MFEKLFNKKTGIHLFAIIIGTIAGLLSVEVCLRFNLALFGFNICIILSPVIAGFVETVLARYFTQQTSGAISAIILFIVTNIIGWFFPANPIKFNIFTVGGLLLMIQAAFPLTINCILIGVLLFIVNNIGRCISWIRRKLNLSGRSNVIEFNAIDDIKDEYNILIFNEDNGIDIKKYLGMIVVEDIIEFEERSKSEVMDYIGSSLDDKMKIKHDDYLKAKDFIINELKKKAHDIGANAIVNLKVEYTNYNQQLPPDMLIIAYGTAVIIDEKYL
ncbi:MAG: heavy metal-binding domain-containing protein [Methanosphaera sp.]|uniref:heavy metal-binding domain-containing protein n=1 Tax=Methanosphaera sp. TaxID=2666342 RepID=UPI0025FE3AE4|nr:heavy metal-binding domain-containing protein [Methanosphaera sp.]MCI5867547.1 YbjQ family protein [Methanosphaera sp.]MDD6534014.1 heavy metal-binding domain-containing protein [Methanosphaera sp.]MDY3956176.1 heavy metal-binding domain-containing protein [Methanosphaera sp.]